MSLEIHKLSTYYLLQLIRSSSEGCYLNLIFTTLYLNINYLKNILNCIPKLGHHKERISAFPACQPTYIHS